MRAGYGLGPVTVHIGHVEEALAAAREAIVRRDPAAVRAWLGEAATRIRKAEASLAPAGEESSNDGN